MFRRGLSCKRMETLLSFVELVPRTTASAYSFQICYCLCEQTRLKAHTPSAAPLLCYLWCGSPGLAPQLVRSGQQKVGIEVLRGWECSQEACGRYMALHIFLMAGMGKSLVVQERTLSLASGGLCCCCCCSEPCLLSFP